MEEHKQEKQNFRYWNSGFAGEEPHPGMIAGSFSAR